MNNFYVYVYLDPRSTPALPIYVGKGHGRRSLFHLNTPTNLILGRKINKITTCGLAPIIEYAAIQISEPEAISLEIQLIAKYGRIDNKTGCLCNLTDGGEGTSGYTHRDETKQLFSEQRRGKSQTPSQLSANKSRCHTAEARRKISEATKGHSRHTPEQIAKIVESNKTRITSDETRAKFSKTRLGNTPTKAEYPPIEELTKMVENNSVSFVAKQLGVTHSSLTKYLKRRGIKPKDHRFKTATFSP